MHPAGTAKPKSGDYIDRSRTVSSAFDTSLLAAINLSPASRFGVSGDNERESGLLRDLNYEVRLIEFVVFLKITEANHRLESCLFQ